MKPSKPFGASRGLSLRSATRGRVRFGRGRGRGGNHLVVLVGAGLILLLWGAWDAIRVGRLFLHGEHAVGHVVRNDRDTDDTRIAVGGTECPVFGDVGPLGSAVPVAYPPGHPRDCVVRRASSFRGPAGSILLGGSVLALFAYLFWFRP